MTTELLPCPFCGNTKLEAVNEDYCVVTCTSCGCEGPFSRFSEDASRDAWNLREPSAATIREWQHKAQQYDDVVKAVHAADGGRYRADTIEALLLRLKRLDDNDR